MRNNKEKEMSSGALMGYGLLAFAGVILIAFGIFVASSKLGADTNNTAPKTNVVSEQSIDSTE